MNKKTEIIIFCENIKRIRIARRLSKKEMAKALMISVKSLTLIEKGILPKRLTTEVFVCIQKEFSIPPCKLFSEDCPI